MNITATIQARMGSKRLPGKVLREIAGKPLLLWQVERLRCSRLIDRIVIATSTSSQDDSIVNFCTNNCIDYYRGSEDDVLSRIANLIDDLDIDLHVECFGDSPLIDPQIIDEFIGFYLKNAANIDYLTNTLKTTYPPGMEVSVYSGEVLQKVNSLISADDPLREHVGFNITRFKKLFKLKNLEAPKNFNYPDIYLEVDTQDDFTLVQNIILNLHNKNKDYFSLVEILNYLHEKPDLAGVNRAVHRRWKSLRDSNCA